MGKVSYLAINISILSYHCWDFLYQNHLFDFIEIAASLKYFFSFLWNLNHFIDLQCSDRFYFEVLISIFYWSQISSYTCMKNWKLASDATLILIFHPDLAKTYFQGIMFSFNKMGSLFDNGWGWTSLFYAVGEHHFKDCYTLRKL
jgi:hypothetical protein